jgi:hypothetical protein
MNRPFLLLIALLLGATLTAQAQGTWRNAPIGCSGRTFGAQQSASSSKMFIRTDVSGLYVQTSRPNNEWESLTIDNFGPEYDAGMSGCLGLGIHPTNEDILYAVLSKGIYKSTNGGQSWTLKYTLKTFPNGSPGFRDDRQYGESLMIDTYNPDVVYFASQDKGIFYSRDAGASWSTTASALKCSPALIVDNTRAKVDVGTPNERAQYVYVGIKRDGLYRSTNGGTSFSKWTTGIAKLDTGTVRWLRQATNGDLYAVYGTGLARWNGTSWVDKTPVSGQTNINALATDPTNADRLLCGVGGQIYRSIDRGNSWTEIPDSRYTLSDKPAWLATADPTFLLTGAPNMFSLAVDREGNAYGSFNYFPWLIKDIWKTSNTNFVADAIYKGVEMTINFAGTSLPPGTSTLRNPVYISGLADVRGFAYIEPTARPQTQITVDPAAVSAGYWTPNFTGIDFCETSPRNVWFIGTQVTAERPQVYRSSNAGLDVLSFKGIPVDINTVPNKLGGAGKIAVSATSPDKVVVVVRNKVAYTNNNGATWLPSVGIPSSETLLQIDYEYDFDQLIKSDRVDGNKFYLVSPGGNFYISTNGGQNFTKKTATGLPVRIINSATPPNSDGGGGIHMAVAPGREEEVWISMGAAGIWRATGAAPDKTDSFTKQTFFANENPTAVSFGAARDAQSPPAVYVYGRKEGTTEWGIWKSDDLGATWLRITPLGQPGQWGRLLVADRQVYGRVFMGDASYGSRYFTYNVPSDAASFDPNKCYKIINRKSDKNLEVQDNSTVRAARIVQNSASNGANQLFKIVSLEPGYYRFMPQNRQTGQYYFDVIGGETNFSNGAAVQQYTYQARKQQQFEVSKSSGDSYTIKARHSGKFLGMAGASTANEAILQQFDANTNGGQNQQFFINEATCPTAGGRLSTEPTETPLKIYPNPASDKVELQFSLAAPLTDVSITFAELSGRSRLTKQYSTIGADQTLPVDVTSLNAGTYLIQVRSAAGQPLTAKFVKLPE